MEIRPQEGSGCTRVSPEYPGFGCRHRIGCAFVSLELGEFLERGAQVSGALGRGGGEAGVGGVVRWDWARLFLGELCSPGSV